MRDLASRDGHGISLDGKEFPKAADSWRQYVEEGRVTMRYLWLSMIALLALACSKQPGDQEAAATNSAPLTLEEQGQRLFTLCATCHVFAAPDSPGAQYRMVGPNLYGVYGTKPGSRPDFNYSRALRQADFIWDEDHLDGFLASPRTYLPQNRMAYQGLADPAYRAAIIAYLKTAPTRQ